MVLGLDAREFFIAPADDSGPPRRVNTAMLSQVTVPFPAGWSWTT